MSPSSSLIEESWCLRSTADQQRGSSWSPILSQITACTISSVPKVTHIWRRRTSWPSRRSCSISAIWTSPIRLKTTGPSWTPMGKSSQCRSKCNSIRLPPATIRSMEASIFSSKTNRRSVCTSSISEASRSRGPPSTGSCSEGSSSARSRINLARSAELAFLGARRRMSSSKNRTRIW